MAEHEDVRSYGGGGVVHRLDQLHALVERPGRLGADRALRRQPHVRDEDVGAGLRHRPRLIGIENVRAREQIELVRRPDHLDLERIAHAGLLEVQAEDPVDEPDRREVLDAREAELLETAQEHGHEPERVGAAHAGQHGRLADDREHFGRHLDDDRVRVAVRHEAGERAAARHPVAARVVDDDQVTAAGLGTLGREARAGARADDRASFCDLRTEPLERFQAVHAGILRAAESRPGDPGQRVGESL